MFPSWPPNCAHLSSHPPIYPLTGVDPQVAIFQRLREPASGSGSGKELPWAHLTSKRPHSHDVRAMCVAAGRGLPEGPRLYTGSNDTQLFSYSVEQFLKVRS